MLLAYSVHMEESSYAIYLEFLGYLHPKRTWFIGLSYPDTLSNMQGLNSFTGIFNLALPLLLPLVSHHSLHSAHTKVFQRLVSFLLPHFQDSSSSFIQKNPAYGTTLYSKLTYFFAPSSVMVQCTKWHLPRPTAQPSAQPHPSFFTPAASSHHPECPDPWDFLPQINLASSKQSPLIFMSVLLSYLSEILPSISIALFHIFLMLHIPQSHQTFLFQHADSFQHIPTTATVPALHSPPIQYLLCTAFSTLLHILLFCL